MKMNLYCEDCGCKRAPVDKFCTDCGTFLERGTAMTPDPFATSPIPFVSIGGATQSIASETAPSVEKTDLSRPSQKIEQASSTVAAAPKSSHLKIAVLSVVLLTVGAGGAYLVLKGSLFKGTTKSSSVNASPRQGTSGKTSSGINITGQMLIDAAIKGNVDEFQYLMQQLKTRPTASTLDRKQARTLNDEALKAIRAQDYAQAIKLLKSAREADLADAEISNNLGYALRMAEDFKASESQLIKTIEQFPARQQAWLDLGATSSKLGKHAQAVAAFVTAHLISKNPEKLLERYINMIESSEDDALKTDLTEVTRLITASK